MQKSYVAALVFLAGLCLAAWLAARAWDQRIVYRFLPVMYCVLFGFIYSMSVLDSTLIDAASHSLMTSIVGAAIVFGLWVDSGTRPRRDR
jgi:hypothetical protein